MVRSFGCGGLFLFFCPCPRRVSGVALLNLYRSRRLARWRWWRRWWRLVFFASVAALAVVVVFGPLALRNPLNLASSTEIALLIIVGLVSIYMAAQGLWCSVRIEQAAL